MIATGSSMGTISLWAPAIGKRFAQLQLHSNSITRLEFSPTDPTLLASASQDDNIILWRISASHGAHLLKLMKQPAGVLILAWNCDGSLLASVVEHNVCVFDSRSDYTRRCVLKHGTTAHTTTMPAHTTTTMPFIQDLAFSPTDPALFVASYWDCIARLHRISDDGQQSHCIREFLGHQDWLNRVRWLDGETVITCSGDGTVKLWGVVDGTQKASFEEHSADVVSIAVSGCGLLIASTSSDHTCRVFDAHTQQELQVLEHPDRVNAVAFNADGRLVITGCDECDVVRVWEVATGEMLAELECGVWALAVSVLSPTLPGATDAQQAARRERAD